MAQPSNDRQEGPHHWMRPFIEFVTVVGLCLVLLLVIIPAGTAESDNFGLSPRMLPIATISTIAIVSVAALIAGLLGGQTQKQPVERDGLLGVFLLVLATFAGIFIIDLTGIVIGGTVLVVLSSLAIGERRAVVVGGMGVGAMMVLLLVEWAGL